MKKLYTLLSIILIATSANAQVVISQVYGGGGNLNAPFTHDFVELFNRGNTAVNIGGWSIQYASPAGTAWSKTDLPSFNLQPGQYYLVQEAIGANTAGTSLPLPTADLVTVPGSTGPPVVIGNQIAIGSTNVKILLANTNVLVSAVANPTDSQIVDIAGFGSSSLFEGTVAVALSSILAGKRNGNGCTDTNNNLADFVSVTPTPRNSSSPLNSCALSTNQNSISGLKVYPNPITNGKLFIVSDSNDTKSVVVYDVLGKQVLNTTATDQAVNLSELTSGVYIVKITENGKTATRKLVIK
jgi:Lamin Tail Domain/Secretion system C-terminal sorting domain